MARNSIVDTNSQDTTRLRTYLSTIEAVLLAGGWVRSTDTGQIDLSTVTMPATATTIGYIIYKSNDATGSLHNFYVKITWRTVNTTGTIHATYEVGWSTNGSGTINSGLTTAQTKSQLASSQNTTNTVISAKAGWLTMACFFYNGVSINYAGWTFTVERCRDTTGALTDTVLLIFADYFSNTRTQVTRYNSGVPVVYPVPSTGTSMAGMLAPNWGGVGTDIADGAVGYGLVFGCKGGFTSPSDCFFGAKSASVGAIGTIVPINIRGTAVDFIYVSDGFSSENGRFTGGGLNQGILLRYET